MKKFTTLLTWALLLSLIITESCSKGGSGGGGNPPPPPPPPPGASLTVIPSKTTMWADGWEEVGFVVKNQNNQEVTSSSQIYINNALHNRATFWTSTPGTYKIKALSNGVTSPEVDLVVSDPGASPFAQKILVEDYTGTWCCHCPRVGINLETYTNTYPNTIVVANHGPSNDPYTFSNHAALANNIFGSSPAVAITGYPNVAVDRSFKWNENNSQLTAQFSNRRAPVGLGFTTLINGNTINVTAKVKFDVTTNADVKLVVYLVEDGIVYPQVNYGYFGLPNPISNYVHKAVLRASGTDLFGDMIDKGSQTKGNIYTKSVAFNATGYNLANCRIVAFTVVGANNMNHKGVMNVQTVKAGENKDFD